MPGKLLQFLKPILFGVYALAVVAGLTAVVLRDPIVVTPRHREPPSSIEKAAASQRDLARWELGAVVRTSGYDTIRHHHPLFLIDGVVSKAAKVQKWVSDPEDEHPWFEIELQEPMAVNRIRVAHAGVKEHPRFSIENYDIVCSRGDTNVGNTSVSVDDAKWTEHQVDCGKVDSVRFEFELGKHGEGPFAVRIYEVELYRGDGSDG